MSTHNISFYENFTNIIFQLSSNIIKYTHYLEVEYAIFHFDNMPMQYTANKNGYFQMKKKMMVFLFLLKP